MALEKQTTVDQIEVTSSSHVQVRTLVKVTDGDSVIAKSFHRHAIAPGDDSRIKKPGLHAQETCFLGNADEHHVELVIQCMAAGG